MFPPSCLIPEGRSLLLSNVVSCRFRRSLYGYPAEVVYPSSTHTRRPPTATGYGSPSTVSQGAAFCTRSRGERSYRIREASLTDPDSRMLRSLNFVAYRSRLKKLPSFTPPLPS